MPRKTSVMSLPDSDPLLQHRLRMKAEEREARAHAIAASLDECITLLLLALTQAAATPRGMQARRANRLLNKFRTLRDRALDGHSPCSKRAESNLENLHETLESLDRLVR